MNGLPCYWVWNINSGGKGFQGVCWACGGLGDTAAECPNVPVKAVESEPAEEPDKQECSVEIRRVWCAAAISKKISNRLKPLEKEDEEEEDSEEQENLPPLINSSSGEEGGKPEQGELSSGEGFPSL